LTKPIDWNRLALLLNRYRREAATPCLLVVEDDPQTREWLHRNLQKAGWQVATAVNGRVALERVAEHVPGLILLDLMMPEMDGFEFMHALRQRAECQHVPVIVITAKDLTEEDRRRLNGHVIQILQKGACSTEELLRQIRQLVAATISMRR